MTAAAISSLEKSVLYPEDMNLLKDALVEVCARRGISPDAPEATSIAIGLLDCFQAGIQDMDGLVKALQQT